VQLLAKVYYNLGVERLESSRYSEAVDLFGMGQQLDRGDTAARENLLAAYNNWALAECDAGRYARAAELIEQGLQIDARYPPLLMNDLHVNQRWIISLCSRRRYADAIEVLDLAHQRRPEVELFDRGRGSLYRRWAHWEFVHGDWDAGWNALARAEALSAERDAVELVVHTVVAAWSELVRTGRSERASQLIRQTFVRHPDGLPQLQAMCDLPDRDS
jgi:tetratricopeptide (TPR) repeat protein